MKQTREASTIERSLIARVSPPNDDIESFHFIQRGYVEEVTQAATILQALFIDYDRYQERRGRIHRRVKCNRLSSERKRHLAILVVEVGHEHAWRNQIVERQRGLKAECLCCNPLHFSS